MIDTPRTRLRSWRDADREPFAALLADPEVMRDLGGPIDRAAADAKLDRYAATLTRTGVARLAVETRNGDFLGYAGVMPLPDGHPAGARFDVGWRLKRDAWGRGYATEAARAALDDAFMRLAPGEIVAFTAADNRRSQAVMERLGMARAAKRDFTLADARFGSWHGLVWVARRL